MADSIQAKTSEHKSLVNFVGEKIVTPACVLVLDHPDTVDEAAAYLKRERQLRGWTAQELVGALAHAASAAGEELSLTQQAVSFFETGKAKSIPRWFRFAKAAFEPTRQSEQPPARRSPPHDEMVSVAVIDFAYGMGGSFLVDSPEVKFEDFPLSFIRHFTKAHVEQLVIAEGVGDSMEPTIGANDLVLIDRSALNLNINDRIWACAMGEIGMVKRLRSRGDGVTILSDNPNVPDDHAADGELHIIGRVVGKFSRL